MSARAMSAVALAAVFGASVGAVGVGCTLLVDFEDAPSDGGVGDDALTGDEPQPGGDVDVDPPEGGVEAGDGGGACVGKSDGFNWNASDPLARCCGGQPVSTKDDANCGACFHQCNVDAGQRCTAMNGHYMCRGCLANGECWSNCCSLSFTPHNCVPNVPCNQGTCNDALCGAGAKCFTQDAGSNYCAY